MYASSDVNIVMMMFFELFLLRKISEFPSESRTHNFGFFLAGLRFRSKLFVQ